MRTQLTLLSLLTACTSGETGIQDSMITGTVLIPPAAYAETETVQGMNDSLDTPESMNLLSFRYLEAKGRIASFGTDADTGTIIGDVDTYTFIAATTGDLDVHFTWTEHGEPEEVDTGGGDTGGADTGGGDTGGDTGSEPSGAVEEHTGGEDSTFVITILDLGPAAGGGDTTILSESTTTGGYGAWEGTLAVEPNNLYAVQIQGKSSRSGARGYALGVSGFDPNETTVSVGAFPKADADNKGEPLGGTTVAAFAFNEVNKTWSGEYTIWDIRGVKTCEEGEPGCKGDKKSLDDTGGDDTAPADDTAGDDTAGDDTAGDDTAGDDTAGDDTAGDDTAVEEEEEDPTTHTTVNEEVEKVFLHTATRPTLALDRSAGTLFATDSVRVDLTGKDRIKDVALSINEMVPLVLGWSVAEIEPNDAEVDGDNNIIGGEPQVITLPPSGEGVVDTIVATMDLTEAEYGWAGPNDAFSFTVEEPTGLNLTMDWTGVATNLDLVLHEDNVAIAIGWDPADVQPETISSTEWGITLQPGHTYTLVAWPWEGAPGLTNYRISLEWAAP
jgi:hypothetical protein